jgi:hypothetical protein
VRINISVELAGAVEIHGKTEPVRVWAIKQAN